MTPPFAITYGAATHVGRVRSENQDTWGAFEAESPTNGAVGGGLLFVVADGMGGHEGGQEASQMAVDVLRSHFVRSPDAKTDDRLREAVVAANRAVYDKSVASRALLGMGTTCTALAVKGSTAWIAHVGDSRAYRVRAGEIEQLSRDHTQVEEMVRMGLITPDEAAVHPQRHALLRSLGLGQDVDIDLLGPIALQPGDRFLLCSDGLAGVPLPLVSETVTLHPPQVACDLLVDAANEAGGSDNTTVLILHIADQPGDNGHRRRWWPFGH